MSEDLDGEVEHRSVEYWRREAEQSDSHEWCEDCESSYFSHFDTCPHCERQLVTDGGEVDPRAIPDADCPGCDDQCVREAPEAGYATCHNCGERGYRRGDTVDWWRNDPDSMWYTEEADA